MTLIKQLHLNNMVEQASEAEKRQFKATASVFLNNLRKKMRRKMSLAKRKIEANEKFASEWEAERHDMSRME